MPGSTSTFKQRLDPAAVLRRAASIPGCKNIPIPNSPLICSFLVGMTAANNNAADKLARVSVFTDTGTVSIGRLLPLPHGNNTTMRQVFRRNVTSLDTVEDLLRDPPQLTEINENLLAQTQKQPPPRSAPLAQLQMAEVGCAILEEERNKLHHHVAALEKIHLERKAHQEKADKAKAAAAAAASSASPGPKTPSNKSSSSGGGHHHHHHPSSQQQQQPQQATSQPAAAPAVDSSTIASPGETSVGATNNSVGLSGMEFQFSLPPDAMKDVDRCLTDIHSMGKLVRKVATNGRGTVFLYGNGGVAYTPQIPKALYHRLSQLRHSSYEHRPAYVSLGSRDRYYCSFHDGSYAFKGPKGLDRELKKAKKQPVSVAFGSTYDTFCVVFADGSWKCGGRAIPADFEEKLGKRRDVHTANLGPEGEWFLKLHNNPHNPAVSSRDIMVATSNAAGKKLFWGGIHNELEAAIDDLVESGHQLHFLDFGDEGSYFVSYD